MTGERWWPCLLGACGNGEPVRGALRALVCSSPSSRPVSSGSEEEARHLQEGGQDPSRHPRSARTARRALRSHRCPERRSPQRQRVRGRPRKACGRRPPLPAALPHPRRGPRRRGPRRPPLRCRGPLRNHLGPGRHTKPQHNRRRASGIFRGGRPSARFRRWALAARTCCCSAGSRYSFWSWATRCS